ncbi:MAG: acyltransferase [Sporocytophaga sp.]|uniref:acyltransferase family protein n=1 Tax=Sporocytophaga sp. TaxID=2231183 RepID=UPI001B04579F|nr:acyltransferase [Sporocytophaga sp.]MBO9698928.1 acyltransferase [Sporocytophaga sp.]
MNRLRELDFLRGIAIILVLARHKPLFSFTSQMGWIGVDLFFVLSGFLVSGLLFKEYLKHGTVNPARFLIRRGFKIYPIYYLFYIVYLIPIIFNGELNISGMLFDLTFVQNYFWKWGYAYGPSWSLAVEEHFYIGFSLFLWAYIKLNSQEFKKQDNNSGVGIFGLLLLLIVVLCFSLRLYANIQHPDQSVQIFTRTHFRIDSLLAGVFVSYLYYFKFEYLSKIFSAYKYRLLSIALAGLCWTPFVNAVPSLFAKTIGFTLLYISFSIILVYFLLTEGINHKLNSVLSASVVDGICKIGFSSFSIYVIHTFINTHISELLLNYKLDNQYVIFFTTSILSISIGMLMTLSIEKRFLQVRDKLYPSRVI